jgi:hypothetical protein
VGRVSVNLIGFIVVTIVVPWTLIWLLRRVGARWSTGPSPNPILTGGSAYPWRGATDQGAAT